MTPAPVTARARVCFYITRLCPARCFAGFSAHLGRPFPVFFRFLLHPGTGRSPNRPPDGFSGPRPLRRLCRRALVGLSRTGSYCGNGSGELVIVFTTANRMPHYSDKALLPMTMLHDDAINPLFRAVAECVEESVLSSLLHAETVTGNHGRTFRSLTELLRQNA